MEIIKISCSWVISPFISASIAYLIYYFLKHYFLLKNNAAELIFIYMLKSELDGGGIKKYSRKKTIKK